MTVATPPGKSILLKFSQILEKRQKKEVTKFGSHSLSGFRVAANTMVVWDKNPPVGNRDKMTYACHPVMISLSMYRVSKECIFFSLSVKSNHATNFQNFAYSELRFLKFEF